MMRAGRVVGVSLHPGQSEVFRADSRFKVITAGRRWGKTKLILAELLRAARKSRQLIWYVAPTYRMAKQIMWVELMDAIPREWIVKSNETALEVHLKNKSRICLKGADKPDTLRGVGINFLAMDEVQDMRPEVWEVVLRPTLASTRGKAIFAGCVHHNTLVLPRDGMKPISSYAKGSPDKTLDAIDRDFYGLNKTFHKADGFWNNGIVDTRKIKTQMGFELEASLPHPVWVMGKDGIPCWKATKDLQVGDRIAIDRGMEVWGDKDPLNGWAAHYKALQAEKWGSALADLEVDGMTDDLAYFMGLWLAEGSYEYSRHRNHRITITCGDPSVGEFLTSGKVAGLCFTPVPGRPDQWRCNSKALAELMRFIGMPMVKAPEKMLPAWVMQGKRSWAAAFVAGMWDGDGHCISTGAVRCGYSSASKLLVQGLQLLLTNIGVMSRLTSHSQPPTARVAAASIQHRLTIGGTNVGVFRANIPLRIERKANALAAMKVPEWSRRDGVPYQAPLLRRVRNSMRRIARDEKCPVAVFHSPLTTGADISYRSLEIFVRTHGATRDVDALASLAANLEARYYWDEIVCLESSSALTYDFTIPDTNSFWSNGFISHNTPKSFNYFHDLFQKGQVKKNRERGSWISWQFPTMSSPFIPLSEIEAARADMDERSFRQEFEATFESMSGRVYYQFSRHEHVGDHPFNPQLPIWVGQDFNVDPMSSVILQQQPSGEVWAVDEIYLANSNTASVCDELERRFWRQFKSITLFPDPAGANRSSGRGESDLDIFRERGLWRIRFRRKHPPVADRVNAVNRMLRSADGIIRLRVNRSCRHLIESLEQTLYKKNSPEIDKTQGVEHITDALGYAIEFQFPRKRFEPAGLSR